ncbi:MAG: hypothetical protein PVJ76_07795 [Gemmatimonadota bacterium]|jgi:hypothetical protein
MALSWAIPWGVVIGTAGGLLTYLLVHMAPGVSRLSVALEAALANGIAGAVLGFATGSIFSLVLMAAERQRSLPNLRARRFALWGALAGALPCFLIVLPPVVVGAVGSMVGTGLVAVATGLGSASAVTSLRIAQSGLELEPGIPPTGARALEGDSRKGIEAPRDS